MSTFRSEQLRQPYKVFTALVTQNGASDIRTINWDDSGAPPPEPLVIGRTYLITADGGSPDFTNIGAPNNNNGTYFIATGEYPNSWGNASVQYDLADPVVTVLENTIGNIWCKFEEDSNYSIKSNGLFTENKTILTKYTSYYPYYQIASAMDLSGAAYYNLYNDWTDVNTITLRNIGLNSSGQTVVEPNSMFTNWLIEIRVYN